MMARCLGLAGFAALALAAPVAGAPRPAPVAAPAPAPTVRTGVDLWRAGDWAGAVAIWQPFAANGDADAMFNMGQAYKLGRAVPMDKAVARDWYRKAAVLGHLPAQANLGILLFQAGEKPEAARWLKAAADRGEMRAQYVLGVAHWNGDGVAKSLPLAYAYLARASAQGLAEATNALATLTGTISPVERANGWAIATSLAAGNGVPAAFAPASAPMSTAELNRANAEAVQRSLPAASKPVDAMPVLPPPPAPKPVIAPVINPSPVPAPPSKVVVTQPAPVVPSAKPPPPVLVTTPTPVERPPAPEVRTVELAPAKPVENPPEKSKPAAKKAVPPPPGWRVQLGAFGKQAQAEAAWAEIKAKQKAAIGTAKPIYDPGTSIIKLQMGPYKTRDAAKDACAKLAFAGRACFVIAG